MVTQGPNLMLCDFWGKCILVQCVVSALCRLQGPTWRIDQTHFRKGIRRLTCSLKTGYQTQNMYRQTFKAIMLQKGQGVAWLKLRVLPKSYWRGRWRPVNHVLNILAIKGHKVLLGAYIIRKRTIFVSESSNSWLGIEGIEEIWWATVKSDREGSEVGGINNSSQLVNHPVPTTICHKQENVRPFNQGYNTAVGQAAGNLSVSLLRNK